MGTLYRSGTPYFETNIHNITARELIRYMRSTIDGMEIDMDMNGDADKAVEKIEIKNTIEIIDEQVIFTIEVA